MRTPLSVLKTVPLTRMLAVLLSVGLLGGCAEGGIGGTGGFAPEPALPVTVSGTATKGPFEAGASVTATSLQSGSVVSSAETTNLFGEFELNIAGEGATRLDISGIWYSENRGTRSESATVLSSIVAPDLGANINVATHLIHLRVLTLMDDGMSVDSAISTATDELTLALGSVLPAPANPVDFNELTVINARQSEPNAEGNAWLLALSALAEFAAINAGNEPGEVLNRLADDLADDGTISSELLAPLTLARGQLDPDRIHSHLLSLDIALSQGALDDLGVTGASEYACDAVASTVICMNGNDATPADSPAMGDRQTIELDSIVANSNRFLDTDGDGVVNTDDNDDDGDGIEDNVDPSPYGFL